jgi:hypothetical protein
MGYTHSGLPPPCVRPTQTPHVVSVVISRTEATLLWSSFPLHDAPRRISAFPHVNAPDAQADPMLDPSSCFSTCKMHAPHSPSLTPITAPYCQVLSPASPAAPSASVPAALLPRPLINCNTPSYGNPNKSH